MKRALLVVAVLFVSLVAPALAQSKIYAANGKIPPLSQLNLMLEDTLARFDKAMKSNNFDAFLAWSSTPTRDRFKTGAEFGKPFKPLIDGKADLSVLVRAPRSYPKVVLEKPKANSAKQPANRLSTGDLLSVEAKYTLKTIIIVDLQYLSEKGQWRLASIRLRGKPRT